MPALSFAYVKEHPYQVGGIALIAIVVVYYYYTSSSSSSATAADYNPATDPNVINAEIQAASQQQAITAQSTAQTDQLNAQ